MKRGAKPLCSLKQENIFPSLPSPFAPLPFPEWRVCPHLCWDNLLLYLPIMSSEKYVFPSPTANHTDDAIRITLTASLRISVTVTQNVSTTGVAHSQNINSSRRTYSQQATTSVVMPRTKYLWYLISSALVRTFKI